MTSIGNGAWADVRHGEPARCGYSGGPSGRPDRNSNSATRLGDRLGDVPERTVGSRRRQASHRWSTTRWFGADTLAGMGDCR